MRALLPRLKLSLKLSLKPCPALSCPAVPCVPRSCPLGSHQLLVRNITYALENVCQRADKLGFADTEFDKGDDAPEEGQKKSAKDCHIKAKTKTDKQKQVSRK